MTNPTKLALYARDLKRKQEDTDLGFDRKVEDIGFEKGTRNFDIAKKQYQRSFGAYPSDIPKLVSLRAAKEDEISAKDAAPPKRDFSKMQFLDDGMKKGGKVNLKNCKISTHAPSKKQPSW
jgi:hypothetical protein